MEQVQSGKRRFKAVINNETYIVIGNKPDEHVKLAASLVNEQLAHLKAESPQLKAEDRAILLALNTVSKQISLEQDILQLKRKLTKLEVELDFLKHPDKALIRGKHDLSVSEDAGEKQGEFGVQKSLFDSDDEYMPAIHRKTVQEKNLFKKP